MNPRTLPMPNSVLVVWYHPDNVYAGAHGKIFPEDLYVHLDNPLSPRSALFVARTCAYLRCMERQAKDAHMIEFAYRVEVWLTTPWHLVTPRSCLEMLTEILSYRHDYPKLYLNLEPAQEQTQ